MEHPKRSEGVGSCEQWEADDDLPIRLGRTCSLSMFPCTQVMSCSMYAGAAILVGRCSSRYLARDTESRVHVCSISEVWIVPVGDSTSFYRLHLRAGLRGE